MAQKLIIAAAGFLVLGFGGYFALVNLLNKSPKTNFTNDAAGGKQISATNYDFGDAPDGGQQQFPSLLASNGARTRKTDEVRLGQEVTTEADSKQVDADEADDGVKLNTNACQESTAYFLVRLKNPGQAGGTVYLNLYADWNKDGKWSGSDECGTEWAIRNLAIDPGKQTEEIAVYTASFTAGKNTEEIWYRGAVTVGQQMDESATGEFGGGEIEDYSSAVL